MSSIGLNFFLEDKELKNKHELALPTNEMYRFFPPKEEIILSHTNPKKNYRFIFNGQPKTDYEEKKLLEFQDYENQHGKLNYPSNWLESDTMRLLQACEYDIKKTYKLIEENIEFLNNIPKTINQKIISLLNSGFLYLFGRDHHFRPILVVSIKECSNLIIKKGYSFDDINQSIIYLINYTLKYILIPGQIENWIIIVDFKDVGLSDISQFKKILKTLSSFRGRVFKNYMINITGFLKFAVKAALKVFGGASQKKLKILGPDELIKMQEIISPDNLQKYFGGTAPNIIPGVTQLFPPIVPSNNYAINGEYLNIVNENSYKEMCLNSKPFKPFIISPKYEKLWTMENEKESSKTIISDLKDIKSIKIDESNFIKKEANINKNFINEDKLKVNKLIKPHENRLKKNKENINNYLKAFEGLYILEHMEEKKYYNPSPIDIKQINLFFKKLQKRKIFTLN